MRIKFLTINQLILCVHHKALEFLFIMGKFYFFQENCNVNLYFWNFSFCFDLLCCNWGHSDIRGYLKEGEGFQSFVALHIKFFQGDVTISNIRTTPFFTKIKKLLYCRE